MGEVRLGPLLLRWCSACNLPVLRQRRCARCGGSTEQVTLTPPGDVRPCFTGDLDLVNETVGFQFGVPLAPRDRPVVMNRCPYIDRMDEVIYDGRVQATLKYVFGKWQVLVRQEAGERLAPIIDRGWVEAADDAVPFVLKGGSLLAPGVRAADPAIKPGDEVIVRDANRRFVAAGTAKMTGPVMAARGKGMAVKVRHHLAETAYAQPTPPAAPGGLSWDDVLAANKAEVDSRREEAVGFITATVAEKRRPVAVSFSGGKDSLATLLLALDAGLKPPVLFVDTGLEFEETLAHVHDVVEKFGLELIGESAGDRFFDSLQYFGPPSKDYRWCCKALKLGPITRIIKERYPRGVLTLIGQRAYESMGRSTKGRVWKNPWVEKQIGASPVQHWTALHIFLYLMAKGEKWNPWYDKGMERIGCYMCPAASQGDLEVVAKEYPGYERWRSALAAYAEKRGYPEEFMRLGLWRWKTIPPGLQEFIPKETIDRMNEARKQVVPEEGGVELQFYPGSAYTPCDDGGLSKEGAFSRTIQMERASNFLVVLGKIQRDAAGTAVKLRHQQGEKGEVLGEVEVFVEGAVTARAKDKEATDHTMNEAVDQMFRGIDCIGCGVCVGKCPTNSVYMQNNLAWIKEDTCIHCFKCMERCPITSFSPAMEFKTWEYTPQG